jgi:tetratricopeptide (TPR) repeat protein
VANVEAEEVSVNGGEHAAETNLNILDLGSILQSLGTGRRTGTLKVSRPGGEYALFYFKGGALRLANSAQPGLTILEEAMVKYRKMTHADLEALREASRDSDRTMIQVISAQERLDERELERLIVTLTFERATDILSWKDVHCEFFPDRVIEPDLDPGLADFTRGAVVDGVLLEAARRADEWDRIQATFDPANEVFEMVREVPEHLSQPAEQELARFIDGYRDVTELVAVSSMNSFQTCMALLEMVNNGYIRARRAGELIQLGGMASARGEWPKALKLYLRAQTMDRERSDLPVRIATAYEALGNVEEARHHLLGYVKESMDAKRFPEAARACERLVELDPEEVEHRAKLFRCLLESGEDERLTPVGRELVRIYEERGVLDRASEVLSRLREMHPDDPEFTEIEARIRLATAERTEALIEYEKLADSYLANGELEKAISTFRKILDEIDEECLEARLQMAECLIQLERIDEAVAEYTRLAEILTRTGVFDESVNLPFVLKVHRRVAELDPTNTRSREWLAETFAQRGNQEQAIAEFDELLSIYQSDNDRDRLMATLARIADLYPDVLHYREWLAECFLDEEGGRERAKPEFMAVLRAAWQQGDFESGVRVAERLLTLEPFYMEAHVLLGESLLGKGEKEAAVEKMLAVAMMYMGAGLVTEAEEVLKEVLEHDDRNVDANRFMGAVLEERGVKREAAAYYKQAGLLAANRADFGSGRAYLQLAAELDPDDGETSAALTRLSRQFSGS